MTQIIDQSINNRSVALNTWLTAGNVRKWFGKKKMCRNINEKQNRSHGTEINLNVSQSAHSNYHINQLGPYMQSTEFHVGKQ